MARSALPLAAQFYSAYRLSGSGVLIVANVSAGRRDDQTLLIIVKSLTYTDYPLMHPELAEGIRSYAALLVVADVVGFAIAVHMGRRLGIRSGRLLIALVVLTVVAFGGAKLFSIAQRGWATGSFAAELGVGYRFPGAVAALALVLATCGRFLPVPPAKLADVITPAFPFAMAISSIGCFLTGCCGGRVCGLPWAVQFPAATQVWGAAIMRGPTC